MRAMLLAAGVGDRMLPLSLTLPKPALPVLGRALALQILHQLERAGVEEVVVNLHHHAEKLRSLLVREAGCGIPALHFTHEVEVLGTAGGLRNAAPLLRGAGPILVRNSDFLADIDIEGLVESHRASGCLATLVLAPGRLEYTGVRVDAAGRVLSLGGDLAPNATPAGPPLLFTGCHVIEPELLDRIPPAGPSCIVRDVYRYLIREGTLGSYMHGGYWWEFGTPELFLQGSLELLDLPRLRREAVADPDPVLQMDRATVALGAGARLDDDAHLEDRVALGFACRVGSGTRLRNTVVMPEAWVGPGCRLDHVVVAPGVELPAGYAARRALICSNTDAPDDLPANILRADGLLVRAIDVPVPE